MTETQENKAAPVAKVAMVLPNNQMGARAARVAKVEMDFSFIRQAILPDPVAMEALVAFPLAMAMGAMAAMVIMAAAPIAQMMQAQMEAKETAGQMVA